MSKLKSILLLCALAGGAYLWFQLSNLHIAIGERATGGYDGASTRSPEDVDRAVREAEEAAAKAQAARPGSAARQPGRAESGRAALGQVTLRGRRHRLTRPAPASTSSRSPSATASRMPGTLASAGMPNSRATMAPWDR